MKPPIKTIPNAKEVATRSHSMLAGSGFTYGGIEVITKRPSGRLHRRDWASPKWIVEDRTMAKKPLPTQAQLRQLLRYEPETGRLFWRERGPEMFMDKGNGRIPNMNTWNKRYAGKQAFTAKTAAGYLVGRVDDVIHYAHRIIWKMETGSDPNLIDHENRDRSDNRFTNLRDVTPEQNLWNLPARADSISGMTGVKRSGSGKRWIAQIIQGGKHFPLGTHDCFGVALRARREAELRLRGADYARKQIN